MQQPVKLSSTLPGLVLFSACWLIWSFSPLPAQQSRHEEVTEVVVVEVPVQVTRDGEPVRGLTADQFEVIDGRKRRDLIGFDAYDFTIAAPEAAAQAVSIPPSARRHFLLFFDLSFSDPSSIVRARHAAKELVSTGLVPTDLVAVATYSGSSGAKLILGFTSDRQQVDVAIDTLGLPQLVESRRDPLGITMVDEYETWAAPIPDSGGAWGKEAEAELLEAVSRMESSIRRADDKSDILALVSSMTGVAELLRSVDGRKHLIYLSEGFNSSIIVGQGGGSSFQEQQAIQEQNEAAMRGEIEAVDSNLRFGDTSTQNQLSLMLQEFVRADCVIQAVDIGGLRAGSDVRPRRESKQGLFMMADGTGGEFVENFNNLTEALGKVLERTSVTYVLAFQAEDIELDGRFHKLKVKLKGAPKGTRLTHRPGYYAPKPYAELSPQERTFTAASQLFGDSIGDLETATLAAPFELESELAYVPTLIEIAGEDLLLGNSGEQVTAEIYAYALSEDGRVHDYFNQIIGLDLQKTGAALEGTGLKFWNQFALPPGDYVAKVLVRNAVTGTTGVSIFPIRVPDTGQGQSALLAPMFPEPPGAWMIVRGQRAAESAHDYPFIVEGEPFIPAAKPSLERGQTTAFILAGYGLGATAQIEAELLTLAGDPVEGAAVSVGERKLAADPALAQWAATLRLETVEAGEYVLSVTATDPASDEQLASSIVVSVAG